MVLIHLGDSSSSLSGRKCAAHLVPEPDELCEMNQRWYQAVYEEFDGSLLKASRKVSRVGTDHGWYGFLIARVPRSGVSLPFPCGLLWRNIRERQEPTWKMVIKLRFDGFPLGLCGRTANVAGLSIFGWTVSPLK